ncbi:monooxygenase [Actinoplanes sp. NPDC051470]|uniref:monooxygenase n=1 Tax=Actinoplanes sp. NPDC051470 TaxID=3157224 RepID=UPI00342072A4
MVVTTTDEATAVVPTMVVLWFALIRPFNRPRRPVIRRPAEARKGALFNRADRRYRIGSQEVPHAANEPLDKEVTMPTPTPPRRILALATATLTATLTLAACSSSSDDSATTTDGASASPHGGHSSGPPAPAVPLRAGERFVNLKTPEPYTPSPPSGGTDEYRCLLIDPQFTEPGFLTGTQFDPQNKTILHHALINLVRPEDAAVARAKDDADPGPGWTCFGSQDLGPDRPTSWVDTWTPNGIETVLKQDVGFPVKPGGLVLLQVHYNLLATDGRPGETDQSGVRLRLTKGTAATTPLETTPVQAPIELPCATGESGPLCDRATAIADVTKRFGAEVGETEGQLLQQCSNGKPVPGNTQRCDYPVPQPVRVYAGLGHMHLLGRSIKVEVNPGTANAKTLLDVPAFNFDDQKYQVLPTPSDVKAGDIVRVTCTHDASLRKLLPQLSKLPPRYVVWGDGTSDEMCSGILTTSAVV